jgi:hypothetical protein
MDLRFQYLLNQPSYMLVRTLFLNGKHYLFSKLKTGYRGAYSRLPCVYWLSPASLIFFGPNMLSEKVAGAVTHNKYLNMYLTMGSYFCEHAVT